MALKLVKDVCKICLGEGWVCENHPQNAWQGGNQTCCGGAGKPCKCNDADPPWAYLSEVYAEAEKD